MFDMHTAPLAGFGRTSAKAAQLDVGHRNSDRPKTTRRNSRD